MSINGRDLVRHLFASSPLPRFPFIPLICSHAARIEQISTHDMLTDPKQLNKALQNAQALYNYDAVTCVSDPSLEAEACGCPVIWGDDYEMPSVSAHPGGGLTEISRIDISDVTKRGRLPVALEAARRLKIVLGRRVAVVGVVTGPLTLAGSLIGRDIIEALDERQEGAHSVVALAARVAFEVCKAYCSLELDAIIVADRFISRLAVGHCDSIRSLLTPLWNIVRFHNAYSILWSEKGDADAMGYLCSIGADAVTIGADVSFTDLKVMMENKRNLVFGGAIPSTLPANEIEEYVANYRKAGIDRRAFFTTEGEVPGNTSCEHVHGVVKAVTSPM